MLKDELQGIISGTGYVTNGASIQAVANYLRKGKEPSANAEKRKFFKKQETAAIIEYAQTHLPQVTNSSGFTKRQQNCMQR